MKHLFCRLSVVGRHCRSINSVSRGKSWHGATVTQDKVLSRKAAPHSHLLQGTVRRETLREPCFVFLRLCARFRSDSRNLTKREKTEREREGGRERAALDFFAGYPVRQLFSLLARRHWKQQKKEELWRWKS